MRFQFFGELFLFVMWTNIGVQKSLKVINFFWLENILSPEGSCESRTEGGPIVFTYVLFWLGNDFDTFKITLLRWPFFFLENVLFPDGVGWDGMGLDGVSKVSFNFLYTLWVYRSCICLLFYIVKNCPHKFLVGLKFWSSWGSK